MAGKRTLLIFGALMCAALAACGWESASDKGITFDIEKAALNAYPELPTPEETLEAQERGRRNFMAAGCAACHSTTRERGVPPGPPLGGTAERLIPQHDGDDLAARRWLFKHIRDPQRYPGEYQTDPDYRHVIMMPHNRIPDKDLRDIVEFIWLLP
jgi:hypothetical protein